MTKLFLAGSIGLLAVLLSACSGGEKKETTGGVPPQASPQRRSVPIAPAEQRQPAPEIAGKAIDGTSWRLSEHRGKVVLIDFWATWCGPCRKTIPHLVELRNELGPRGLEIVGVSLDRGINTARVEPMTRQMGVNYPILIDSPGSHARAYGGIEAIPTFFLIDRLGRVAARVVGGLPKGPIQEALETLLAEG